MAKPLRVGIIGCGVISRTHVESFQNLDDVEVRWACDIQIDRAEALASKLGIAHTTADAEQVFADDQVDLVSICTDHASHVPLTIAAFEHGKHVLCEKALAATNAQLDQVLQAHADHPHLVYSGVFQHRFDGAGRVMRDLVANGSLGRMLSASMQLRCLRRPEYYADDWHGTWDKEGGSVLINQAIHFVDALAWIMGGARGVLAQWANLAHEGQIETEDTLAASVEFDNGALGTVEVTSGSNVEWQHTLSFSGTEGTVEMRNNRPTFMQFADATRQDEVERLFAEAADPAGVSAARSYYGTGHPAQIADVVDAVREGREPFVTGEQAAHAVRLVLAAYASGRQGQRVEVESAQPAGARS